jgi:DNA/RNA non-specific endonuclease
MKKIFLSIALLLVPVTAFASNCDQFFPNKKEIVVPGTSVLCNTFYATVYDTAHERAIFSTEAFLPHADKVERTNDFHADSRLKNSPTPSDYDRTGYDRGHLTPAADADTAAQMSDFSHDKHDSAGTYPKSNFMENVGSRGADNACALCCDRRRVFEYVGIYWKTQYTCSY